MVDLTFQAQPGWYGTKEVAQRAEELSRMPFQRYERSRIAPFSRPQNIGFDIAEREATNPEYGNVYGQAVGTVRNALGQNILPQLQPYLNQAIANPTTAAQQYMNPYQEQVVNRIGELGSRNLTENILPGVRDRFINAGQYGSAGHQKFANRAVRDTQEAITGAQGQALQGGYNTALNTAVGQQERNLQAAQLTGNTQENQLRRQLAGAEGLQALGQGQQSQGLRTAGFISQLGGQQQQQAQNELTTQYQDWQNEMAYPHEQLKQFAEIQRGLPVTGYQQYKTSNPIATPGASPWTQGAGLVAGLTGAFNQRPGGYAKGGLVKNTVKNLPRPNIKHIRHYAGGGAAPQSPIQRGVNDAMDTAELRHMREHAVNLSKPQTDPFWAAISRAGFNVAANRQPGVLAAIGEGANAGLNEYQTQLANQDTRKSESSRIMGLIDNTRRLQAENNKKYELDLQKFEQDKKEFGAKHSLENERMKMLRAKEGRELEEYEGKKGLIEGPGKMLYSLDKDAEGNRIAKALPGMNFASTKTKAQINESKKINEEAKKRYEKVINSNQPIKKLLKDMRKSNEEIGTNEIEGLISHLPVVGESLASGWKSSRAGQTPLDIMNKSQSQLVSHKFKSLPAKAQTVAHLATLKAGAAGEKYTKEANNLILDQETNDHTREVKKAHFALKTLKKYTDENGIPKFDAPDIEAAYDKYLTAKEEWEATHDKKDKFLQKPQDYLEALENEEEFGVARERDSNLSNESLMNGISDLIG
jgi:hypothetical protein